jgi:hypothetical protein
VSLSISKDRDEEYFKCKMDPFLWAISKMTYPMDLDSFSMRINKNTRASSATVADTAMEHTSIMIIPNTSASSI